MELQCGDRLLYKMIETTYPGTGLGEFDRFS